LKIKELKINAYGKLKNKQIEFEDNINIIQGNNESGKSTLLKFITNIFYGTSKNKKGKEFSDYDRYKPWETEEFSGKLSYTLDNGKKYEVFREFNKKNPKIYNEQLEDISKEYTIDKTYGNQFFTEQTNVDEAMFHACLVTMQQEVKIDKNTQNTMVQKVANLAGTGDDNISYKKAQEKINKKQIEEIGTTRSQGRPINIIKEEKFKLQDEIGELEEFKQRKQQIEKEKEEKEKTISKIEETLELIKQINRAKEEQKLEEEKIKITEKIKIAQEEKINSLQTEKEEIIKQQENNKTEEIKQTNNTKRNIFISMLIIGILIEILNAIFIKNIIILSIFVIEIIISIILILIENKKQKENKKKNKEIKQKEIIKKEELKKNIEKMEAEITVLQTNIEEEKKEIEKREQKIKEIENTQKQKILQNFNQEELVEELFKTSKIQLKLENLQEEKNHKKLEYRSLELEENTINPKLEKIAYLEEQLEELNQKEEELEKNNKAIELTKEILEIAYQKMKQNVTPKLTEELSKNIQKISDGKYTQVNLHEEKGIIIEKENGEYAEAEKLSIGTIDQLYLALRLAMAKELCKETMPIILDEAFAYYDEERLKNILIYLNKEYKENQIIIFTCTDREKDILNREKINYNLIKL